MHVQINTVQVSAFGDYSAFCIIESMYRVVCGANRLTVLQLLVCIGDELMGNAA